MSRARGFTYTRGRGWWDRHSLSIVLASLLVVQSVVFWFLRLSEWTEDQRMDGLDPAIWPGFVVHYWGEMLVSVLADTYGALIIVVLTKRLREVDSDASS